MLYSWVERGTKSQVFCQRTQHNDPGRVQTQASPSLFDFKHIWLISSYFWAKTQITLKEKHYHTTRSSKPLHFALLSQHLLMVFALHFLLFLFQWLVVLPHPLFLGSLPLLLAASNYLKKYIWQTFRNFLWIVCNKG